MPTYGINSQEFPDFSDQEKALDQADTERYSAMPREDAVTATVTLHDGQRLQVSAPTEDALRTRAAELRAAHKAGMENTPTGGRLQTLMRDFNQGLLGWARPMMEATGVDTQSLEQKYLLRPEGTGPSGVMGRGAEVAGEATMMAAGGVAGLGARAGIGGAALTRETSARGVAAAEQATRSTRGHLGSIRVGKEGVKRGIDAGEIAPAVSAALSEIPRTAARNPGTFMLGEVGGGFGAGAAMQIAEDAGAGEGGTLASGVAGGLAGSLTLGSAPRAAAHGRQMADDWIRTNLMPGTREGTEVRLAKDWQRRVNDPEAVAADVDKGPDDLPPMQRSDDPILLGIQERIATEYPYVGERLREANMAVRQRLRDDGVEAFGEGRDMRRWEHGLMEHAAAPGAKIKPGHTDEMLNQAYKSYEPMYDKAKGIEVDPQVRQVVSEKVKATIDEVDLSLITDSSTRKRVLDWFDKKIDKIPEGEVMSDHLISLRQDVRRQYRNAARLADKEGIETRELLNRAEDDLTMIIEAALPEDMRETLRAVDAQYRIFKVVEDAVFHAGDKTLRGSQLSQAIRHASPSRGRYARGGDEELRSFVQAGRPVEEIARDPQEASRMIRGMDADSRREVKADFTAYLMRQSHLAEVGNDNLPLVSGGGLKRQIAEHSKVMDSLGFRKADIDRLKTIADHLSKAERRAPPAAAKIIDDTPELLHDIVGRVAGVSMGARLHEMTGRTGLAGGAIMFAQWGSARVRHAMEIFRQSPVEEVVTAAALDGEIFRALMTRPTSSLKRQDRAASNLMAWAAMLAPEAATEAAEGYVDQIEGRVEGLKEMVGGDSGGQVTATLNLPDGTTRKMVGASQDDVREQARKILEDFKAATPPEEAGTE